MVEILFQLIIGHAFADFALQSEAMSRYKNRKTPPLPPPGQLPVTCWYYWLIAHALIHGGTVYYITHSAQFGFFETVAHFIIDFLKLENYISLHTDQFLHITCKIAWAYFILH